METLKNLCFAIILLFVPLVLQSVQPTFVYTAVQQNLSEIPTDFPLNVTDIVIVDNNITEITNFPYRQNLTYLNLSRNGITVFPNLCVINDSMTDLILNANQLTTIPGELLDCLGRLQGLHLFNNKLTSFPTVCGMAQSLEFFDISYNKLQVLPPMDVVGPKVTVVRYGPNPLNSTHIPQSILATADKLLNFQWKGFRIKELPSEILSHFTSIITLYLKYNSFTEVPDLTPIAHTLKEVILQSNPISYVNWDMVRKLDKLKYMNLADCNIKTIPMLCRMGAQLTINIVRNPLICDHKMKWIVAGHLSGKVTVSDKPCAEPEELINTNIKELTVTKMAKIYSGRRYFQIQKLNMTTFGCTGMNALISEKPMTDLEDCAMNTVHSENSLAFRYHKSETGGYTCSVITFSKTGFPLVINDDMYIID